MRLIPQENLGCIPGIKKCTDSSRINSISQSQKGDESTLGRDQSYGGGEGVHFKGKPVNTKAGSGCTKGLVDQMYHSSLVYTSSKYGKQKTLGKLPSTKRLQLKLSSPLFYQCKTVLG